MSSAGAYMTYIVTPVTARVRVDLTGHIEKRSPPLTKAPSSTVPGIVWSDDRVERLKRLWGDGHSAGRIAALLGGISRSAVIGKVHRLGLSERKGSPHSRRAAHLRSLRKRIVRPKRFTAPRRSRFAEYLAALQASPAGVPPPAADDVARVTFAQLDADRAHQHCRWPVGDPKQPGFGFCGCAPVPGLPYCEQHARRAYAPPVFQKAARAHGTFRCVPQRGLIKAEVAALAAVEEFVA